MGRGEVRGGRRGGVGAGGGRCTWWRRWRRWRSRRRGGRGGGGMAADLDDDRPRMQAGGEGALAHHCDAGHLEHRRRRLAVVRDPQPLRRVGLPARVLPRLERRRRAPADLALLWNRKRVAAVGRTVLEDVLLVVLPLLGRPDVAHGLGEECKPAKPEHRKRGSEKHKFRKSLHRGDLNGRDWCALSPSRVASIEVGAQTWCLHRVGRAMSTALQHNSALQAEQELREQARRNTHAASRCGRRLARHEVSHAAPTAAQARATWLALFSDMTLPTIESSAEWSAWSQQSIDETEAQIRKACPFPLPPHLDSLAQQPPHHHGLRRHSSSSSSCSHRLRRVASSP